MSVIAVPPGQIAAVVTRLDMAERPRPRPLPPSRLSLQRWPKPDVGKYRALFTRVGARWLWFSRLVLTDDALRAIIGDERVEVYAVLDRGIEVGMLELDFRDAGSCEIVYFALVPELTGQGYGRWLIWRTRSHWRGGGKLGGARRSTYGCTVARSTTPRR